MIRHWYSKWTIKIYSAKHAYSKQESSSKVRMGPHDATNKTNIYIKEKENHAINNRKSQ